MLNRRDVVLSALFGSGYLGLRAVATGLPAWYIANPRQATAQDLACLIEAQANMQYLIVSCSDMGDPLNCNAPGTYEGDGALAIHPEDPTMEPVQVTLGASTFGAALPWATTDVIGTDGVSTGMLAAATHQRMNFFHYRTGSVVHGDQPKVQKLMGATNKSEMLVSIYARYLAPCLGTIQPDPISVGAGRTAAELLTFQGRPAANVSPNSLKAMLGAGSTTGGQQGGGGFQPGRGGGNTANSLRALRPLRDQTLDSLNALAKSDATGVQSLFLDALSKSQQQVRSLSEALADTLSAITGNTVNDQALAAAALISANVTPVVTMHIAHGGDNHTDTGLANEIAQYPTGVQGIQQVQDALATLGLQDRVTFAVLNVFGRNLNGIAKVDNRSGRDHYGNHAVSVLIGKNIAPGVTGGVAPGSGSSFGGDTNQLGAAPIDSTTGLPGGAADVPAMETYGALARTLGVALGIPHSLLATDFNDQAGGKVINTTLNGVTG